jgi:hypothetical protein
MSAVGAALAPDTAAGGQPWEISHPTFALTMLHKRNVQVGQLKGISSGPGIERASRPVLFAVGIGGDS